MSYMTEQELDRYCWLLVSWRNRFAPPVETADECIDIMTNHAEDEDKPDAMPDDEARGREYGYHTGMFVAFNEMIEQLYGYGINVLGRANRYTHVNRQHDMEFRTPDEPDFYRTVKRGAESKVMQSDLFEPIEIERLDWNDPYVPVGADE